MFPDWRINFDTGAMEELLGRSGITNDTTVIGYGQDLRTTNRETRFLRQGHWLK
jgi:3-mercaptopyruvate sulfurtransferase SseA